MPEPAPTEATIDRKVLRSALRLWHSTLGLGGHPLAQHPLAESRRRAAGYREAAVGRGLALRDVLRLALEGLRPTQGDPDPSDERWRPFLILSEQYLGGRKPDYVAGLLSIARSTYDHEQAAALDGLAEVLHEWVDHPPPEMAPTAAASVAAPFMAPPPHPAGLLGRADRIDTLRKRLVAGRGDLALHGLPGVGKTALAVELSHDPEVRTAFPDGVLWAGLGQRPDLSALLALWGAALGLSPAEFLMLTSVEDRARLVHSVLGSRRLLLVVDDVWDTATGLVFRLGGERCARLYTCRSGAMAAALAPESDVRVPELGPADGVGLLQRSTGAAGPLADDEALRLVAAVGSHPLALVLMGRYLGREGHPGQSRRRDTALSGLTQAAKRLTIEEARSPLEQQPSLSAGTSISLDAVLALSDESLSEQARHLLRRLAFFPPRPGTFGEAAALAATLTEGLEPALPQRHRDGAAVSVRRGGVSGGPSTTPARTISAAAAEGTALSPSTSLGTGSTEGTSALDELVDSGLVEPVADGRYSLHPVVSDYARLHTDSTARSDFAARLLRLTTNDDAGRAWIAGEVDNLLAALEAAAAEELDADYLRGALGVFPVLEADGRSQVALPLLERAESIARASEEEENVVGVLARRARAFQHLGDYAGAESAAKEALEIARRSGMPASQPELLLVLGAAATSRGDAAGAEAHFGEGLCLAEAARSPALMAAFEANLASLALKHGEMDKAEPRLRLALRLAQAAGDRVREASVLINLGVLLAQAKRFDEADAALQEAAELTRLVGTREQQVFVLTNLGALANDRGDPSAAEAHFTKALGLARSLSDPALTARLLANLGALAAARGDHEAAEAMYTEGLDLARASGHQANVRLLEHNVAELRRVRGG